MGWIESLILGIVQGITEFLPVSRSGHLELVKYFFGNQLSPKDSLNLTVILHLGTVFSTLVYFRKSIITLFKGIFLGKKGKLMYLFKIILSMIPAALVGILFNNKIELLFSNNVGLVAFMLCFTSVLLFLSDRVKENNQELTIFKTVVIGFAQAVAILPGVSRSGATITTGVLARINRESISEFSFLMVIPLILGKIAKDVLEGSFSVSSELDTTFYVVGFLSAFISGLLSCKWMISLVKKSKLRYFGYYCLVLGVSTLIFINFI